MSDLGDVGILGAIVLGLIFLALFPVLLPLLIVGYVLLVVAEKIARRFERRRP